MPLSDTPLSDDAIIFGLGFLNGAKMSLTLSARTRMSKRGRDALDSLLEAGYAAQEDQPGREQIYRGQIRTPSLGQIAIDRRIDPFSEAHRWPAFETAK